MQTIQNSSISSRYFFLDWLRVLAFGLLIFYHTAMFFVEWGWHIKNNVIDESLQMPMLFVNQWRMSLLFLISGSASYYALLKLSQAKFFWERFKRVFIPLVFGMLVIVPPQIYFERLTQGKTYNYFEFWATVFQFVPYPDGGSLSWHHLWYLAYLFVYSLICLPLFAFLMRESVTKRIEKNIHWLSISWVLYLFAILQLVNEVLLRDAWESTNNLISDWYNHGLYLGFFVMGFYLSMHKNFWEKIQEQRFQNLAFGLISIVILYSVYWINWVDLKGIDLFIYRVIKSINRWLWILTILGFGKKYLSFNSKSLKYANEAVYPFYILHQSVIISIAYWMINWQWSVAWKFSVIVVLTFAFCWICFEFLIGRFNLLRFLFGLKIKSTYKKTLFQSKVNA
jgi:glucans biosynthesis protein C